MNRRCSPEAMIKIAKTSTDPRNRIAWRVWKIAHEIHQKEIPEKEKKQEFDMACYRLARDKPQDYQALKIGLVQVWTKNAKDNNQLHEVNVETYFNSAK